MPRVIRDTQDLGPGKPVLIYGAGERGAQFARDLLRAGIPCRGFLDSFKAGECCGLPVYRYQDAPAQLLEECRVVIASFLHGAIANRLSLDGCPQFSVLADRDEDINPVPLARDTEEALDLLATMPISLGRQGSPAPRGGGARLACNALDQCLWVGMDGVKFCCFMPDLLHYQPASRLVPGLESLRRGLYARIDEGRPTCCGSCMFLTPSTCRPGSYRIRSLSLGHNSRCNFECSYCKTRKNLRTGSDGLALRLVRDILGSGRLRPDLEFSWAGEGEPVVDPDFEGIVGLLLEGGSKGLIYTNASIHSPLVEDGLRDGRLRIVTSLDAGTPPTFRRMHGVDAFDRVVETLRRYRAASGPDGISLKYILTPDNAGEEETARFVRLCGALDVHRVIISSDYTLAANPFAGQTEDFRRKAQAAGLEVSLSPWTA